MSELVFSNVGKSGIGRVVSAVALATTTLLGACGREAETYRPSVSREQIMQDLRDCEKMGAETAQRVQGQIDAGKASKTDRVFNGVTGNNPQVKPNLDVLATQAGEARRQQCMSELAQVDPRTRPDYIPPAAQTTGGTGGSTPGSVTPSQNGDGTTLNVPANGIGGIKMPDLNTEIMIRRCSNKFLASGDEVCNQFTQQVEARRKLEAAAAANGAKR